MFVNNHNGDSDLPLNKNTQVNRDHHKIKCLLIDLIEENVYKKK